MLMTRERRPAIRTMRGWAIDVLQNAGAVRECEEHGWMQDRADPQRVSERICKQVSVSLPLTGDSHDDHFDDYA